MRFFLDHAKLPLQFGLCVEGVELGRLSYTSIGMIRGEISCEVPEEYDWTRFGAGGAISTLNDIISRMLEIPTPDRPRTAIVLGRIEGGTSASTIATRAALQFEVRSESGATVRQLPAGHLRDHRRGLVADWRPHRAEHLRAAAARRHRLHPPAGAPDAPRDAEPVADAAPVAEHFRVVRIHRPPRAGGHRGAHLGRIPGPTHRGDPHRTDLLPGWLSSWALCWRWTAVTANELAGEQHVPPRPVRHRRPGAAQAGGRGVDLLVHSTLNEERTIGKEIVVLKSELMDRHRLLDEIAVIDSGSDDATREVARAFGADVYPAAKSCPNAAITAARARTCGRRSTSCPATSSCTSTPTSATSIRASCTAW